MANVRAGIAYVDVRLGSIEQFKNRLKSEIEGVTNEVSKRVGDDLAKKLAPEGAKAGKVTASEMSKAFFADANRSFMGGLRALATGQFSTFRGLMAQAGAGAALGFRSAFDAGINGARTSFRNLGTGLVNIARNFGANIGEAFASLPGKIATAGQAVDSFSKRIGFLSFQLQNFGIIASTAFTAPVAGILAFGAVIGIKTAVQIENATAALKSLTPAGTDVEALIKRLQKLAQESPIFNSADLITFTQRMVASGLTIQETEAFLKSFGNIALTVGADVSKIPFALEALVQMAGKGKVSMEELRLQLGDALPGAMTIVSEALGVTTGELYEMVEAGELTGDELIKALTKFGQGEKFLKGAAEGAETMGAKWQELKESVQNQLGQIFLDNADKIKEGLDKLGPVVSDLIKEIGPVFPDLIKGFTGFIQKLKELIDWYKNLSPSQQDIINKLILFASVAGPLVLALGFLAGAVAGISALLAALATPAGLVIFAIIALGVEIFLLYGYFKGLYEEGGKFKEVWDKIWKEAQDFIKPLKDEWDKTWPKIKEGFQQVKDAVSEVKGAFNDFGAAAGVIGSVLMITFGPAIGIIFGIFKGLIAAIGPLFQAVASFVSGIIKFLGGIIVFITGVFTGDWDQALKGLELIWDGLWDAVVGTIVNVFKAIWNFVKGFVTGIVDFFKWLWDVLVGHSIIPDMVNAILDWFKRMKDKGVQFIKNLGKPFVAFYNDYVKPFIDKIKSGADRAWSFIGGLKDKIVNGFKSAGSWLIDAGKNIVNGLINGVKRMGNSLKNAILDLIPGPVRGIVENALGISSPSKVFEEIGRYVVQGFIEGLQGEQAALAGAMGVFNPATPARVSPTFGDPRDPLIETPNRGPAMVIENYNEAQNDPDKIAEDFYFKINSRGGGY